jgi:pimeloyl-ACP methyl ester carboxylesterase
VAFSARVDEWRRRGEEIEFRGRRIHTMVRPGRGPLVVLLHGFPSSSYDWRALLERLDPGRAVACFDFLGFGLSDKPADHVYGLGWQADLTAAVVEHAGGGPVHLVAHDMGTSVATELMARELRGEAAGLELAGALLFNGSMLIHLSSPTTGQRLLRSPVGPLFARLMNGASFRRQFARIFSDGHPLSREEADDQWELLAHGGGNRIAHRLVEYMAERERLTDRWHGALRDWPGELRLCWGLLDPVATPPVLAGLRELRPGVPVEEWPDLGHYPQLEDPARVAAAVERAVGG